jgi:hypothetical protein
MPNNFDANKGIPDHLIFEASELGFPCGTWPATVVLHDRTFNKLAVYYETGPRFDSGSVQFVHYVCLATGELAVVFND